MNKAAASSKVSPLRNIGIIAHIDAGKTTLSERILFYTRKIHRMGEVHEGAATMDFMPEEQERGITISSACTSCVWNNISINLIDTPGHVDFTIEVERSLRVLDGAVGVFCAVGGVEPQSETVWKQSEHFKTPKLAFINKMDRPGADFASVLASMRERLRAAPLPITMPLGQADSFIGILDLISLEKLIFNQDDQGRTYTRSSLSEQESVLAAPWRDTMLETLAEADDIFCDLYLNAQFNAADIQAAVRRATLSRALIPTFAGSALRNIGVQPLLDAILSYLPAPEDRPFPFAQSANDVNVELPVPPDPADPFMGLVFKVLMDSGRKLSFLRIYAGTLKEGDVCRNVAQKTDERVGRLYRMHAEAREQIPLAKAGDIVAVIGFRSAKTGDTLASTARQALLEPIFPQQPVITLAVEARNADEAKTLDEALERLIIEDPTLTVSLDEATGHRILSGMGELHLDVVLERIRREYFINPRTGRPQAICRETVAHPVSADGLFDRELGKEYHHGAISITMAPLPRNSGNNIKFAFDPRALTPPLPPALMEAARQGLADSLLCDAATGYPLQDVEITVTAMQRKEGLSTAPGFHMAAGSAVRAALSCAKIITLEPLMFVEISAPEDWMGAAISLFSGLGGKVDNVSDRADLKIIEGLAPLSRLFGFSTALRSATQGRAGLMMRFERFDVA
jgi:elongation factor G